jgi:Copper binding proteins, plastocyanin/azurin family
VALVLAIAGALALGLATAVAGEIPATATVVAQDEVSFVNPAPFIEESAVLRFQNNDNVTHNVTAEDDGPDGKPLFRSGNLQGVPPMGPIVDVKGTQFLAAGAYAFLCTIHPAMQGTLTVGPFSGPLPRPSIEVKIKSKKLEKVVKSGKLKVKVSANEPTDADGVSLTAKKGAKGITKRARLNVNAGDSKTAKLKLKKKAAAKLADLDKAKVKVQGTVDFGFGDKASKKLK